MIRKAFWSLAIVLLACSSGSAADVRRVVTGLDASNKAVVLFEWPHSTTYGERPSRHLLMRPPRPA